MIQTHRNWKTRFRPRGLEALEDRAVPSAMGVHRVHAEATTPPTTTTSKLAQLDTLIDSAYTAFATSVFAAETTFANSGGTSFAPLASTISVAATTLETSLISAFTLKLNGTVIELIGQQINGPIGGSMLSGMEDIVSAATLGFPVTTSAGAFTGTYASGSIGLLDTALEDEITTSLTSTTNEVYLDTTGTGKSNLNLESYDVDSSAIFTGFARTVSGVESILNLYAEQSTPIPVSAAYAQSAVQIINAQIGGLAQGLNNLASNTTVASRASVIQGQLTAASPGSVTYQFDSLLGASASSDGSIADSQLLLLEAALNAAVTASFTADSVEAYILATA